jgi:hypothetical protein
MIRSRKIPRLLAAPKRSAGGWSRAIQRMDEALRKNAPSDYSEQIEILGRHMFGDLWTPRHLRDNPNQNI